jgi:hypothetical protein
MELLIVNLIATFAFLQHIPIKSKLTQAITLVTYIQGVPASNIGRVTEYRDRSYCGCTQYLPENIWIAP